MLFTLHRDFGALNAAQWQGYADELHNLLMAHRNGWHVFLPDRVTLDNLSQCAFLGEVSLKVLASIRNKYVDLNAMKGVLKRIVTLFDPHAGHAGVKVGNEYLAEMRLFRQADYLMPFQLVVESVETDGAFWQLLLDAVGTIEVRRGICPRYNIYNGGGGSISQSVRYLAPRKYLMFCIVDSDKRSPFAPMGDTAAQLLLALKDCDLIDDDVNGLSQSSFRAGVHILSGREAENLVPLPILEDVLHGIGSHNFAIVRATIPDPASMTSMDCQIWAHYDVKATRTIPEGFCCPEEGVYFAEIEARVGASMRLVRDGLLRDFVDYHDGAGREQKISRLGSLLMAGPDSAELKDLFWNVFSMGCIPPARWT